MRTNLTSALMGLLFSTSLCFAETNTSKRKDGSSISYYFYEPSQVSAFPIVLILQGSECRSAHRFSEWAQSLNQAGAALLIVEKYALTKDMVACPDEYIKQNSIFQRVADVQAVVEDIHKKETMWNHKLVILAGSEGTLIASNLTTKVEIHKMALISGGLGMPFGDSLLLGIGRELESQGKEAREIEQAQISIRHQLELMKANPSRSLQWAGELSYFYWNQILGYAPWVDLLKFNNPILLLQGTDDTSTPVESAQMLVQRFQSAGKTNLDYLELKGFTHDMMDRQGISHMRLVIQSCLDWLLGE